jgi:hypothetical protein
MTALHLAAEGGNIDAVRLLTKHTRHRRNSIEQGLSFPSDTIQPRVIPR